MDMDKNQKGNLTTFVVLTLTLVLFWLYFKFGSSAGGSGPYFYTVLSGTVGLFLGKAISYIVAKFNDPDSTLGGPVGLFISLSVAVIIIVFLGIGLITIIFEGDMFATPAVGNGVYAGTLVISGISGLFGANFNQLEKSD